MHGCPITTGRITELAYLGLGQRQELFGRVGRQSRIGHQHKRAGAEQCDGCKVAARAVRQVGVERRICRQPPGRRQHNGVAIGSRFGHQVQTQSAAGTGLVVHRNGLAQALCQFWGHDAGGRIAAATCRKSDHQADWLVRPGCRLCPCSAAGRRDGKADEAGEKLFACVVHGVLVSVFTA